MLKLCCKQGLLVPMTFGLLVATTMRIGAEPLPLENVELAEISGQGGLTLVVHLVVNASVAAGFRDGEAESYVKWEDVGGVLHLSGIQLDVNELEQSVPYGAVRLGMPTHVSAENFGFGAVSVTSTPALSVTPETNFGQLRLNGSGQMTGSLLFWSE